MRDKAIAAARKSRYAVSGYVLDGNGWNVLPFNSADEADDWYGRLAPNAFVYAAYFDRSDPTFPAPLNEKLGEVVRATPVSVSIPRGGVATVSGEALVGAFHTVPWLWPFLTGAFGGVIAERKFGSTIY